MFCVYHVYFSTQTQDRNIALAESSVPSHAQQTEITSLENTDKNALIATVQTSQMDTEANDQRSPKTTDTVTYSLPVPHYSSARSLPSSNILMDRRRLTVSHMKFVDRFVELDLPFHDTQTSQSISTKAATGTTNLSSPRVLETSAADMLQRAQCGSKQQTYGIGKGLLQLYDTTIAATLPLPVSQLQEEVCSLKRNVKAS